LRATVAAALGSPSPASGLLPIPATDPGAAMRSVISAVHGI